MSLQDSSEPFLKVPPRSTQFFNVHSQIDQFRYIKIQSQTIDLRTMLCGINPSNALFIPQSLVLRSVVRG